MVIWVDGDACPKVIKAILFKAAERVAVEVVVVANQWLALPTSPHIRMLCVEQGPDVADDAIADQCKAGDLVVTADIPLAARVVDKGAHALDPRGTMYDKNNIGQILGMRDFMDSLRGSGIETGGPSMFGQKERLKFANELDRFIARNKS